MGSLLLLGQAVGVYVTGVQVVRVERESTGGLMIWKSGRFRFTPPAAALPLLPPNLLAAPQALRLSCERKESTLLPLRAVLWPCVVRPSSSTFLLGRGVAAVGGVEGVSSLASPQLSHLCSFHPQPTSAPSSPHRALTHVCPSCHRFDSSVFARRQR